MKTLLHIQNSLSKARCRQTSVVCSEFICGEGGSEGWCHTRKIWLFFLSFKLRNSIPSTQTDTKLLYKYKHIFFLKTGSFNLKSVPLSFSYNYARSERLSSQSAHPQSTHNLPKPLVKCE